MWVLWSPQGQIKSIQKSKSDQVCGDVLSWASFIFYFHFQCVACLEEEIFSVNFQAFADVQNEENV